MRLCCYQATKPAGILTKAFQGVKAFVLRSGERMGKRGLPLERLVVALATYADGDDLSATN